MKKQIYSAIAVSVVLLLMSSIFSSCIQEVIFAKATVETSQVTSVTEATAISGGVVTSDGGSNISVRGVCWNISPYPTIENDTTTEVVGTGPFTSLIKGLSPSTTYYVRAYAINKGGTSYGLQMIFTTKTYLITTTPVAISLITATSAIGGGNIISDGDSSILTVKTRGVCWNTFPSPTIENSKTSDGVGGGRFTSKIDSLTAFTTYFARAYATNGNGTIYGNEVSFTTQSGVVDLATTATSAIMAYTATSGGTISSDGGAAVTSRGVCWNTSSAPTIDNLKTANGSGTSTFTSSITGLTPGTTYYVRSYAINSVGTSYGNEVSFTTQNGAIGLTTDAVTSITTSSATIGGTISNDGGATLIIGGVCWSTTTKPTIALSTKTSDLTEIGTFSSSITGLIPNTTYYVRIYATNNVGACYGNELIFTTRTATGTVNDIDGNLYHYITIGNQTWMVENLKTTRYRDGTSIPNITSNSTWNSTTAGAWCDFNNEATYGATYGHLYNYYAAQHYPFIAPVGWHIPSDAEWTTLTNFLGGLNVAGGKLKETGTTHWGAPNTGATNETGFTALPGGCRDKSGTWYNLFYNGFWWSSSLYDSTSPWYRYMFYNYSYVNKPVYGNFFYMQNGLSIRCIRD